MKILIRLIMILMLMTFALALMACTPSESSEIFEVEVVSIHDDYVLVEHQESILNAKLMEATNPEGLELEIGDVVFIKLTYEKMLGQTTLRTIEIISIKD